MSLILLHSNNSNSIREGDNTEDDNNTSNDEGWWKIRLKIDIIKVLVLSIARRDNKALFYTSFEYADLTWWIIKWSQQLSSLRIMIIVLNIIGWAQVQLMIDHGIFNHPI